MFPMLSFLCFCFPSHCSFWASSIHCSMWHCHHSSLSTRVFIFILFIFLKTFLIFSDRYSSSSSTRPPLSPPPPPSFVLSVLPWVNSLEEVCFHYSSLLSIYRYLSKLPRYNLGRFFVSQFLFFYNYSHN